MGADHARLAICQEALSAICSLADELDHPSWLDGRPARTIVACVNGLLDVERRQLLPHTPRYWNSTSVPFSYDIDAPRPDRWLSFLGELWPDEPADRRVGRVVRLCHFRAADQHKILLMVGPTRGGKGVIARVLAALIGQQNVAGPTLNSLGGDFGLAPLIGKPLAIISDARFVGKQSNIVVERLLSITGEDVFTVNRKYREHWTQLPSRLLVISNELPKLGDASAAIVGRIILLLTSNSWLGREDRALEPALHDELSGILNWSFDGLERLTVANGNRFTHLASSDDCIDVMRDLASPVGAFVREQCETGPDHEVAIDEVYATYRLWADNNGHTKLSKATFGGDLRAVCPHIGTTRPREAGGRHRAYRGIGLRHARHE